MYIATEKLKKQVQRKEQEKYGLQTILAAKEDDVKQCSSELADAERENARLKEENRKLVKAGETDAEREKEKDGERDREKAGIGIGSLSVGGDVDAGAGATAQVQGQVLSPYTKSPRSVSPQLVKSRSPSPFGTADSSVGDPSLEEVADRLRDENKRLNKALVKKEKELKNQ
jgi:hypothetical protein